MNYYSHSGNKILIGHFPGQTKIQNKDLIEELSQRKFNMPDNIGIVCPITKDQLSNPLIRQLSLNGYSYYNSLADVDILWRPERKILHVLNSLKICKEEYALVLDTNDVVILDDLDDIINRFETYGKRIIYNSTIWMFPHEIIDDVENRGQYGTYCFLNAGCAIGKTSDLIDFYQYTWDMVRKIAHPESSEQYYIRKAFDKKQEEVFFDWDCRVFQCWHKQEYDYRTVDGEKRCYLL